MEKAVKLTKHNSVVMSFRVLNDDKKRIEKAARRVGQQPSVFARTGVLNEVDYVENQ